MRSNAELVAYWCELFNERRFDEMKVLVDPHFVDQSPLPGGAAGEIGPDGVMAKLEMFLSGLPDATITPIQQCEQGDTVASRYVVTGTHSGPFMGVPPTGKQISFETVDFVKIVHGLTVENWALSDVTGLMAQLNAA